MERTFYYFHEVVALWREYPDVPAHRYEWHHDFRGEQRLAGGVVKRIDGVYQYTFDNTVIPYTIDHDDLITEDWMIQGGGLDVRQAEEGD